MADIRLDSHKLLYHPARVAQWMAEGDCFPLYVEIGLTNRCNHRCVFCALDWLDGKAVDMDRDVLLAALKDMAAHGVKSLMFAGEGESLLHRDAPDFIRKAHELGMKVALTTNGVPLTHDKAEACLPSLSWVRFSVNGGTAERYAEMHGTIPGDFDRVLGNIAAAAEIRKRDGLKVGIDVQTLLLPENAVEVVRLGQLVKEAGADDLQVKPYSQHPLSRNRREPDYLEYKDMEDRLRELEDDEFRINFRRNTIDSLIKGVEYKCCYGLPFFALINAWGDVLPCNLFYEKEEFAYGNLHQEVFSAIWKGERRQKVIKKLAARNIDECRRICRLDQINRYLHRLKHPAEGDDFI